jgi:hypothetical protein
MADGRGGAREGAGRPKGAADGNKRWLARIAHQHAENAIATLVEVMQSKDAPAAARIRAAAELLDRAHGKAPTPPADDESPAESQLTDPDPDV